VTRTCLLALALTLSASSAQAEEGVELNFLVERAVSLGANEQLARDLLLVEELAGVPKRLRGMLLAKAYFESRFNPGARGDLRRQGRRSTYKAHGLLQLWPWALKQIRDRDDPIASASVFLGAILTSLDHLERRCPGVRDRWRLAWIRVNRGPFWRRPDRAGEPRCTGSHPAGLKVLKRWKRAIRRKQAATAPE
jgi:hypothetical protein